MPSTGIATAACGVKYPSPPRREAAVLAPYLAGSELTPVGREARGLGNALDASEDGQLRATRESELRLTLAWVAADEPRALVREVVSEPQETEREMLRRTHDTQALEDKGSCFGRDGNPRRPPRPRVD